MFLELETTKSHLNINYQKVVREITEALAKGDLFTQLSDYILQNIGAPGSPEDKSWLKRECKNAYAYGQLDHTGSPTTESGKLILQSLYFENNTHELVMMRQISDQIALIIERASGLEVRALQAYMGDMDGGYDDDSDALYNLLEGNKSFVDIFITSFLESSEMN